MLITFRCLVLSLIRLGLTRLIQLKLFNTLQLFQQIEARQIDKLYIQTWSTNTNSCHYFFFFLSGFGTRNFKKKKIISIHYQQPKKKKNHKKGSQLQYQHKTIRLHKSFSIIQLLWNCKQTPLINIKLMDCLRRKFRS